MEVQPTISWTSEKQQQAPQHPTQRVLRPHSTPTTLMWLEENYEVAEGVCIPRGTLYMHYVDFCARNNIQPVNAASFGKIIRQQFPQLTTRRLGTRGQSRYHYYGIAVRETSPYFQLSYSKKAANSNYEARREAVRQASLYSPRSRLGTMLPEFPNVKDFVLPPSADEGKITTFLMMYRTHCQRVLDTVIRANFDEVQNFLLYFWQGVPPHLSSVLGSNVLVNLVGVCDSILYKAICNVLLPSVLQALPDSLTKVIRKFAQELDCWLRMALYNLPENLRTVKLEMASRFAQVLRRQTSLSHLVQASRMVVNNSDIIGQMVHDWRQIDLDAICRETLYSVEQKENASTLELVLKICKEFESFLEAECPIETYLEWLETIVNKCVLVPSTKKKLSVRRLARQFLLTWSAFGTRVIRDMTLHSAASFGSFHLLRLMFDDYVLYLVEYIHVEEEVKDFISNIPTDTPPGFSDSYFATTDVPEMSAGMGPHHISEIAAYGTGVREPFGSLSSTRNSGPTGRTPQEVAPSTVTECNSCTPTEATPSNSEPEHDANASGYAWSNADYYQSFYQGSNYDVRRPWSYPAVVPRTDNRSSNYQTSEQYVIVSQGGGRVEETQTMAPVRNSGCTSSDAQNSGYDYLGPHCNPSAPDQQAAYPPEDYGTSTSNVYATSGALY